MAEFGIESTHVSDPQRSGTRPVEAVQEKAVNTSDVGIFSQLGEMFAKGLAQNNKDEAEKRKNAVISEYHNNEGVYTSAMEQGSWNSSQVNAASRANYNKFLAAYPEYATELVQARSARIAGTDTGKALQEEETVAKRKEANIAAAQAAGWEFYEGQDKKTEALKLEAYNLSVRTEREFKQKVERRQEERAEVSFQDSHTQALNAIEDHDTKKKAADALVELGKANLDVTISEADNLMALVSSGKMTPEEALLKHKANIMRFNSAANSIAKNNPELAAPWKQTFGELDEVVKQMLSPEKKSEKEAKMLEDQYKAIILRGKLSAIQESPALKQAVVAQALFPTTSLVAISNSPAISNYLLKASGVSPTGKGEKVPPFIGTQGEGKVYETVQKAMADLQSGKNPKPEQAAQELVKTVSTMLKETASKEGAFDPKSLKMATTFYSSPEFGKLAREGKVDPVAMRQAQQVFQVQLNGVVKDQILNKLDTKLPDPSNDYNMNHTLFDMVEIQSVGGQIMFKTKPLPSDLNFFQTQQALSLQTVHKKDLEEGAAALTQLVRLHANLEGEADYGKYWEKNKHMLLPGVYQEGWVKGKVINGYEYLGGDARNPNNFKKVGK